MARLSVSAHDIDAAGMAIEADLPLDWLAHELEGTGLEGTAPVHVALRLSRSATDIVVRGKVRADLTTPCARCLNPAAIHVDTEVSLLLKPASESPGPHRAHDGGKANGSSGKDKKDQHKDVEYEFGPEEADLDTYDGETVELDPFVREAILLEVPNFPLCSEACPGIGRAAAEPVAEPAVDPRLAPLADLRAKLAPQKKKNKE